MKKGYIILFVVLCLIVTGCGCSKENTDPNQNVSALKYYVPKDFKNRSDLRGVIYTNDTRKIFAIGDNNDYSTFMYIDVIKQTSLVDLDTYISDVNTNKLKDGDVKFVKKDNSNLLVYGREGYETQQGDIAIINYAYITNIDSYNYTVTISGPKDKKDEVETIAKNVLYSLQK